MCLTLWVWICLGAYVCVCAHVGTLYIRVKGGRETKEKVSYVWI